MEILIITNTSVNDSEIVYFDKGLELQSTSDIAQAAAQFKKMLFEGGKRNLLFEKEVQGILFTCFNMGIDEEAERVADRFDYFILSRTSGSIEIVEAFNRVTKKDYYLTYKNGAYEKMVSRKQSKLLRGVKYKRIFSHEVRNFGLTGYTGNLSPDGAILTKSIFIDRIKEDLDARVDELFYGIQAGRQVNELAPAQEDTPHVMSIDNGLIVHASLIEQLKITIPSFAIFKHDLHSRLCVAFSSYEEYLEKDKNFFEVKISKGAKLPVFVNKVDYPAFIEFNTQNYLNLRDCFVEGYKYYVDDESDFEDELYWRMVYRDDNQH